MAAAVTTNKIPVSQKNQGRRKDVRSIRLFNEHHALAVPCVSSLSRIEDGEFYQLMWRTLVRSSPTA
jgi:hypothetical protein